MLLCGLAVSKMHMGQFEEAEARLQEALIKVLFDRFFYLLFIIEIFNYMSIS